MYYPDYGTHRPRRHLGVEGGVLQLAVAEQNQDKPDVGPVLQQRDGEAVAESMRTEPLGDLRRLGRLNHDTVQLPST